MGNIELVDSWFYESLKPDPILTVSEWADSFRVLSKKVSSEAGRWRTLRTPYLREIMDCLSISHPAKKVVFKKSAQIGGTECGNNWLGYIIDHSPGPTMVVFPTVTTAQRNSKLRVDPLIEESPRLKEKVSTPRSRDASNTTFQKDFEGGTLIMTGANSAAGLRSTPCRFLFLDEVDAYPRDVEEEGDPISLVLARSRTFSRRKAFLVSTPTLDGLSKIDEEYQESDRRKFHVPCPHCGEFQTLEWEQLKWDEGKPQTALYYCFSCGEGIEERFKTKMLEQGRWIAENPGHPTAGFWINSLYSPVGWHSWADVAKEYEDAKRELEKEKKSEKMRTFINTTLAWTYKEAGEAPEWKRLYYRREKYKIGTVPEGVLFLTCAVDVQKDRLECEVVGWNARKESWSIEYEILLGDPSKEDVWKELESYIGKTFPQERSEDGETVRADFPIQLTAVDSGFKTTDVYNFVRKFPPNRVVAVKGDDNLSVVIGHPKIVDAKLNGKIHRRAVKVWKVGVSLLKAELYSWLKLEQPIGEEKMPVGFCHFPEYEEEYFRQLTAEKVIVKQNRKKFSTMEWVKDRERNEALDLRVYGRAAASIFGLDRLRAEEIERLAAARVAKPVKVIDNPKRSPPPKQRERSKRESQIW